MLTWAMKKIFGTSHDRTVRRMRPRIEAINALEGDMQKLSDAELRAKTAEFKEKLGNGASLDDILIPAFAVCREGGRRVLKMRHYDVQLIGGMVLHSGSIAEMRTGEGKTLVATLPCYLNALEGKGVHVITVNDYLARRDAEWMGKLYGFLGLETGVVVGQQSDEEKLKAYRCDITYGQNNEFGFDYLRDNMKFSALEYAQRPLHYAIVDEVDSILIDEARTPLIISGQGERSSDQYRIINEIIPRLRNEEHYAVDEKGHTVTLTDEGVEVAQKLLSLKNLYTADNLETLHILNQCLRAHTLYKRDVNYMVREGKVLIIDEFTGRVLAGRRWSDGLHQAVEAKENVRIQEESRTMATITFQNLFRLYKKLSGMTGTADTEAAEFHRPRGRRLQDRAREVHRRRQRAHREARARPADPRGDDERRAERRDLAHPHEEGHQAQRSQRQAPRERGVRRRPGGPQGGDHRLDEHGRPRHRHHLGRQRRNAREAPLQGARSRPRSRARGVRGLGRGPPRRVRGPGRRGPRARRALHPRHRAARVTAHRQPAPWPRGPARRPWDVAVLPLAGG
jgi:hypothetical protein